MGRRLPQRTQRRRPPVPESPAALDQEQVGVAPQGKVLESVVKEEYVHAPPGQDFPARGGTGLAHGDPSAMVPGSAGFLSTVTTVTTRPSGVRA